MSDYLQILASNIWDPSKCFDCKYSAHEADELEEGRPQCEAKGRCKYLPADDELIKHHGFTGYPPFYLQASGLDSEVQQWELIASLSPHSDTGQTLQALGWMEWETQLEPADFAELLALWHSQKIREFIKLRREAMER